MAKLKLALYWSASCGGCDVAVLDINEKILDVAEMADIVLWPIAMDFKYHHVEAMPDKSIDVCLFNGAVRNSEQEYITRLLRAKSKMMVAFGACACFGGIPALANLQSRDEILERAYVESPSNDNPGRVLPQTKTKVEEGELRLPEFFDTVLALNHVVDVEYFVPGCPPPTDLILKFVDALAKNELPSLGVIIAGETRLCDECERKRENKPTETQLRRADFLVNALTHRKVEKELIKTQRPHEVIADTERCFLEQGIVCLGPVTRGGCGQACIKANMPCRGCFGPSADIFEQDAAAYISDAKDNRKNIDIIKEVMVDPVGTYFRFGMSGSTLVETGQKKNLPLPSVKKDNRAQRTPAAVKPQ